MAAAGAGGGGAAGGAGGADGVKDADMEKVLKRYQDLRGMETSLVTKVAELSAQEAEHRLVLDTLRPMAGDRKCYHMVGGVLCERTVKEVLPMVESTASGVRIAVYVAAAAAARPA